MASHPAPAAPCDGRAVLDAFATGATAAEAGRPAEAEVAWRPLAAHGFAPAQSRLGRLLLERDGPGTEPLLWLALAAGQWEAEAKTALMNHAGRLDTAERTRVFARAAAWKPRPVACSGGGGYRGVKTPVPDATLAPRARAVIDHVATKAPELMQYLRALDRVDFAERATEPRAEAGPVLVLPAAYLRYGDDGAVARAVMYRAMEAVYAALPGVAAAERWRVRYRGVGLVGSPHPDVDNAPFFRQMTEALDLADTLPEDLAAVVRLITEIRYDPASRFKSREKRRMHRAAGAYYTLQPDPSARRPVTVVRNLSTHGAAAVNVIDLVHEGTHAAQDLEAHQARKELAALPEDDPRREALEARLALWEQRGPGFDPVANTRTFECEASLAEIRAAQALGLGPEHAGSYRSMCEEVRDQLGVLEDSR